FRAGDIDTGYLSRHDPQTLAESLHHPDAVYVHAIAAAVAGQAKRRAEATVLTTVPTGWRNVPNGPQFATFSADGVELVVRYELTGTALSAEVGGTPLGDLVLRAAAPDRVDIEMSGVRRTITVHMVDNVCYVASALGSSTLVEMPRFPDPESRNAPGSLLAPMPGTVVRIAVETGEQVAAGTPVVVLEAMKMEHTVAAPHDGTVGEIDVAVGQAVDNGTVLAVVEKSG
ncbi:MAG: acetyl/propionyl-CoA carboxylase subunit alpha, partial [Pseudonocardiaceae bacterium]|nr:acetyl/propionyl-CoA carboxylase subunit alpha [Pseudonocardiaceae bacterium]